VARLAQARELHNGLGQAAQDAKAQDPGDQDEVARALKEQNDAIKGSAGDAASGQFPEFQQPHLTLASPAGMQAAVQGSMHLASLEHNALTSGAHTSVSAGKSFFVTARNAVRIFAMKAGFRLIAGYENIDIQALRNGITMLGKLNVKIESRRITVHAADEVLISGGGSYSLWNAQGIVHGTNGVWREHAATHSFMGPDSRTSESMNRDVTAPYDQELIFRHLDEKNTPAARQVFRLVRDGEPAPPPDSPSINGQATTKGGAITNTDGTTQVQRSDGPEVYKVRWLGRRKENRKGGTE
jgi:type VI secretion system secreted protein VgrG